MTIAFFKLSYFGHFWSSIVDISVSPKYFIQTLRYCPPCILLCGSLTKSIVMHVAKTLKLGGGFRCISRDRIDAVSDLYLVSQAVTSEQTESKSNIYQQTPQSTILGGWLRRGEVEELVDSLRAGHRQDTGQMAAWRRNRGHTGHWVQDWQESQIQIHSRDRKVAGNKRWNPFEGPAGDQQK